MKPLQAWFDRLDQRTPRERMFLLVAGIAVAFLLWDALFLEPLLTRKRQAESQGLQTSGRVQDLQRQIDQVIALHNTDPDQENRRRLAVLEEENRRLDQRLEAVAGAFISPRDMARALEDLLGRQNGLKLLELTNLPPAPLLATKPGEPVLSSPEPDRLMVYRHPVVLHYEGDFRETLEFIRQVENLPHLLFWQSFELKVLEHPLARISITVFTLSLQKGWIGA